MKSKNENCADVAPKKSQLNNLKKGKPFTSETAKENQPKSVIKRKENQAYRDIAQEALEKLIGAGAMSIITDIKKFSKLDTYKQIALLEHLRDSSGQKPVDKQEVKTMEVPLIMDDI